MKLHLPSGLRKALLACLAALTSRYSLSRTVATGTALLGAFSLLRNGDLRADESLPLDDRSLVSEEETLPPGVNEVAGNAADIGILPIAVTSSATEDVDAGHSAVTGGNVTYSGDIYTWNVDGQLSFLNNKQTVFHPWVADGGTMVDGAETTSGDILLKFFHGSNSDGITYDTLRIKGATDAVTLDTHGISSQANSGFRLGGLIVEEGGSYTINVENAANSDPFALYWGAGTGTNKFEALVLSDITFANVRNEARTNKAGENTYGFHIISDADVRIAKGKTLVVESILQIDAEKTVTLSAVGTENAVATFRVNSIDNSAAASASSLVVGDGVNMEVTEGVTGPLNLSLGANAEFSVGSGSLALTSLTLTGDAASLAMTLAAGTTLTLEDFADGGHTLTIHLDGLTEDLLGETGYALFGEDGWSTEWSGKIFVDGDVDGRRVQLNDQGMVVLSEEGITIGDQDQLNAARSSADSNQAGMTWYIDIPEPTGNNLVYFSPGTVSADIILLQTLTINAGSNGGTVTFNGSFSGAADADLVFRGWSTGTNGMTYEFTGDLSGFHGDMVVTDTHEDTFKFTKNTGDGAITNENSAGEGKLRVVLDGTGVDGGTIVNATVHANDLSVTGNVTLNKNVTITGETTVSEGATLTLGGGAQTRLASLADGSSLTSLTLGTGSEFALDSGSLTLGTLVLAGDNAGLAMTLADGTQLSIGTLTDNSHTLTIHLDGLTEELLGDTGYALFGGDGWNAEWSGKIFVDGDIGGKRVKLNDQGFVVLVEGEIITEQKRLNTVQVGDDKATHNVEGMVWYIDMASGYFTDDTNGENAIKADVTLLQTFKITDGYSEGGKVKSVIFDGAFSAAEGVDLVYAWTNSHGDIAYVFNGDLSGFHGDMRLEAPNHNITFKFTKNTGDGAITDEGNTGAGKLNVALDGTDVDGGTIVNATIHANDLSVAGNVTLYKDVTITGTSTLDASAGLTLTTGTQVALGTVVGSLTSLTLEGESSLSVSGGSLSATDLTICDGGLLTLSDGASLAGDVALNLVTDNENYDDPNWFFAGGIQGLDVDALTSLLAEATINGEAVVKGKRLEVYDDGLRLVDDSSQPGGSTEDFVPNVQWPTPQVMSGDTTLNSSGGNVLNYKIADSFKVTGGAEGMSLRLQKTVTGSTYGNGCHLAGDGGDAALTLANLYLTADPNDVTGDGEQQLYFDIKGANYLSGVQDVWIKNVGLIIQANMNLTTTNFHLGSNDHAKSGGWFNDAKYRKFTLCLQNDLTTQGTLEVVEDARIVFDQVHTLTVGSLTGKGDLSLSVVGGNAATLAITGNSESYGGHIIFAQSGNRDTTVKLGDGVTLSTAGIGASSDDNENPGGRFERQGETGTATVKVTGTNEVAAENVVFGEGVTLELAEGAGQNFGAGSHITALKGAGALWVQGGDGTAATVTVDTLAEYTGEIHLVGNGTEKQAVLQLGGATDAGGGTLSKVVLRQGGGDLNLGVGAWTLNALEVQDAPAEGASQLRIGAAGDAAAGGTTLAFGEMALNEHVELTLGGGIDYSGTIVVDATGGATGARLFEVEDASLLDGLTIKVKLAAGNFNEQWTGLQLFASGLGEDMKNALVERIVGDGGDMDLEWEITDDGILRLTENLGPVEDLIWKAGSDGVWQDAGATMWDTSDGGEASFDRGDSVTFGAEEGAKTVQVEGTVAPTNVTIDGAAYTFNATETGEADSVTVREGMTLRGDNASATFNLPVTFGKAGANITGTGAVTFAGTGAVTASGLVVGNGVTVEVSTSGNKNFDGIEVQEGGRFVVQAANNWDASGNKVHGGGTLVLDVGIGLAHDDLAIFVDGSAEAATLGSLELASGTGLTIGSSGSSIPERLGKCTNIWVQDGAGLSINAPVMEGTGVTLHLAGNGAASLAGDGEAAGTDNGKLASEAALAVWNHGWGSDGGSSHNPDCAWDIVLEGDAKIAVGGVSNSGNGTASEVLTVNGSFDMKGHTLTKVGIATLKLANMQTGADHAGAITIESGTLEISGLAEGATDRLVATTVDLTAAGAENEIHFKVSGDGSTYTVQKVVLGDGEGTTDGTGLAVHAILEAGSGSTLVVTGAQTDVGGGTMKNVALDLREGAGAIAGGGTVELRGKAVGGKGLLVGGAGTVLLVKQAWETGDFTGGLYLTQNGTVQLGADIEIGFLGGTEDGYGGTITGEGTDEHTVTLATGGGSATNVTVDETVGLRLAMESGGQTFMGSSLNGNIDIGEKGALIFDGASGSSITQGDGKSLTGAGGLVVLGGSGTAAALNWMGNSTNFAGTLVFGTQAGGNSFLALGKDMTVGNIDTRSAGTVNLLTGVDGAASSAKLTLNYTGDERSVIAATEETKLTLGTGITFEKAGKGEVEIHYVTGGKVLVSEGKLVAHVDKEGGWAVDSVEVNAEFEVAAGKVTLNGLAGSGNVTGAGTVNLQAATGNFGGSVSSNLVYNAEGGTFAINSFSGNNLTAENGTLTVGTLSGAGNVTVASNAGVTVTNELTTAYTGTVTLNGGIFTAGGTAQSVVVGTEGGTLSGTGDNGLTAALRGDGSLTAQGKLALSGAIAGQLLVDDGAVVTGNDLSVSGVKGGTENTGTLSGSITVTGNGDTNSFGGTVSNLDITVGTGSAAASQAFTGSNITIGTAQVKSQGTLLLSGGTVGTLTLDGGARLDLRGASTKVSITTLNGPTAPDAGKATIVIGDVSTAQNPGVDGLQLDIGALTGFGEKGLILDVNALSLDHGFFEYQLFDPEHWNPDWLAGIDLDSHDLVIDVKHRLTLTERGTLKYDALRLLTWSNTSDGVWSTDGDTKDWVEGAYFETGDNVIFGEEGLAKKAVTVSGRVMAGNMQVVADGYSFTGAESGGNLLADNLELSTGTTTFSVGTTVTGTLSGAGNIVLTDRMSVGTALNAEGGGSYTGTITLQGGTFAAEGTVQESVVVEAAGGTLSGTGNDGLTATLSGKGSLTAHGTLRLSGELEGQLLMNDIAAAVTGNTGNNLSVSGVRGDVGALSGKITVTGNGDTNSFGGKVSDLTVTVGNNARQAFTGSNVGITSAQVNTGGTLSLSGGTVGALTLGDGATLNLRGARTVVSLGTVKGQGKQATIVIGDVSSAATPGVDGLQLDITGLTDFGAGQLRLDVSALTLIEEGFSYQLFNAEHWNEGWLANIELYLGDLNVDGRHQLSLTKDGKLLYTVQGLLTWSNTSDGVWSTDGDTNDWLGGAYFVNGDNVVFGNEGVSESEVTVRGEVIAGEMTVSADGYSFKRADEHSSLRAASLVLSGTGTTTFSVDTTVTGTLTGTGNLALSDNMSVGTALSRSGDNGYTGTITLQEGGTLTASGEANVEAAGGTLSGAGDGLSAALSGAGNLTARGKLTLSGAMGGQLTVDGPQVTISDLSAGALSGTSSGAVSGGKLTLTGTGSAYDGALAVGELAVSGGTHALNGNTTVSGNLNVTGSALTLNGSTEVGGAVSVSGAGSSLTLDGSAITLTGGATVSNGGTLTLRSAQTTLGEGAWLKADGAGSSIALAFANASWDKENTNIELAGGTLDMSGVGEDANEHDIHLQQLRSTSGRLNWGTGKTNVHVEALTGSALDLGTLAAGQELHLAQLKDVDGAITGATNGGNVYLGTVDQGANTTGSIDVTGGVHVHSHGGNPDGFQKLGEGSFAVKSQLIVDAGSLYMNYDGTLTFGANGTDGSARAGLTGSEISVASGTTLKYTDQSKLLLLGGDLFRGFTEANHDSLHLDLTQADLSRLSGGFDLGIVSGTEDSTLRDQLTGVIELDDIEFGKGENGTAGYFELKWHEETDHTYHLYLNIVGDFTISGPEWDMAWGDGLIGAPSNSDMEKHTWSGGDSFNTSTGTQGGFTAHALELGKTGSGYIDRAHTLIRLTQGAAKAGDATVATVVGGIIVNDADDPKSLYYDSYIEYNATGTTDHIHLLVGGSCCVDAGGGEDNAYASFEGTSHIQVESGTVDYIVGGNHVNNSAFTFKGDSYITVFGGQVSGSIVGGSTLTKGTSNHELYAFNGDTHIFIYTPLGGTKAPAISDGTDGHGAEFAAVVGGNAWVDFVSAAKPGEEMRPQFFGHSHITVDLVNPAYESNKNEGEPPSQYPFGAGRGKGTFEKAIVGGNYTAAVTAPEDGSTRNSLFRGDTRIEIYAGGDHTFTAGINGATRRASAGAGTTEFIGNTYIDITGGVYREAIAGGAWFEASATGDHAMNFTGNTNVTLRLGQFSRVVGGSYSLGGGAGVVETTVGNTSVSIQGGTFAAGQTDPGFVAGGGYYNNSLGTYTQDGTSTLSITGGTFTGVHIVGGNYVSFTQDHGTAKDDFSIAGTNVSLANAQINALVVGGSYLSDVGSSGSIRVGTAASNAPATHITVGEGATLGAEMSSTGEVLHNNVVLVGGNAIMDEAGEGGAEGSRGSHSVTIVGDTQVDITGGTIAGHVVGGSYTNDVSGDTNTLEITGTVHLNITGGSVTGNIFGGHYSENTANPDQLILGDVEVAMSGGTVDGYIFGGSFRKATQALGASPTQGHITVKLTGGTVKGGVYAAGNHLNTSGGAALHVRTTSTRVEIGNGAQFEVGSQSGAENQYIVISGGYLRSSDAATRANDFSTVGYTDGQGDAAGTWANECAVLSFTDAPNTYTNLTNAKMRFQDFDAVEVQGGTLELNESQLLVMHKVAAEGERGHDSFAKMGEGSLVLGKGLGCFSEQSSDVGDFTGGFIIEGGSLTLGTDRADGFTQVIGGLQVDMKGRSGGNRDDAYLRGMNGLRFSAAQGTQLKLVFDGSSDSQEALAPGVYYLVDGLDISLPEGMSVNEYFGFNPDSTDSLWSGAQGNNEYKFGLELGGDNNDQLVLRVYRDDPNKWVWTGESEDQTWTQSGGSGELTDDWTKNPGNVDPDALGNQDYYFDAGGMSDVVKLDGAIHAEGVHVTSGNYTFARKTGEGDTLTVNDVLNVGTEGGVEGTAHLRLELATSVPRINVWQGSSLELGHEKAVQPGTQLFLKNASLVYGEDGNGNLASRADLSGQVTADSTGALRVRVGNSAQGQTEAAPDSMSVTWRGDVTNNRGIAMAVQEGVFMSGRGKFVLDWQAGADKDKNFIGSLEAQEGTLELKATGANVTVTAPGESGQSRLFAEKGASVVLAASGANSGVTVQRAFSGTGTFEIGENVGADGATYSLDADNSGFGGTVRLSGNGKDSKVQVGAAGALGGANTTLVLAGRSIVLSGDAAAVDPAGQPTSLAMKSITVEGTNYVGGYDTTLPADANKAISLSATNGISGNGVLASAQGGFSHTLSGDLSGFTGTIAAGVASAAPAPTAAEPTDPEPAAPQSTWTLSGTLTPTDGSYTLAAGLAGTGKVCLNYTLSGASQGNPGKVLLTGDVGDANLGQSVSVEHAMADTTLVLAGQNNTSVGNLIFNGHEIWLGDDSRAGNWMGDVAAGSDNSESSRFVLRNGTLGKALENPENVSLVVDTAAMSTVHVGGTAGSKFDEIIINDGGHLSGVSGDITVGRDRGKGQSRVVLYFGEGSYGSGVGETPGNYLLETDGNLVLSEVQSLSRDGTEDDLKDRAAFVLDFSNKGLIDLLKRHHDAGQESYLHVLSGGNILFNPDSVERQLDELLRTGTYSGLLAGLSFSLGVQGGDLILRGSSSDIYLVLSDASDPRGNKHTVNNAEDAAVLAGRKATLLDEGTVLSVEFGDGKAGRAVTVHNLVGLGGSVVEASGEGTLSLDNTAVDPDPVEGQSWLNDENVGDEAHRAQLKGQDTLFDGLLRSADARTTFVKSGAGTLTVGNGSDNGGVDIAGALRLENGDFTVRGGANGRIGTLSFAYAEGASYKDGFSLQGGKVSVDALDAPGVFGMVSVREQGVFAFTGNNTAAESLPANLQFVGTGTLEIGGDTDGGKLSLDGTSSVRDLNVRVDANSSLTLRDKAALSNVGTVSLADNSVLDLSGSASGTRHSIASLSDSTSGTTTLKGGVNTDLSLSKGGSFSGTLAGRGKLTVAKGAALSLSNVKTNAAPATAWDLTVQGSLSLDTSKQSTVAGPSFRDVVFAEGSTVSLLFDSGTSDTTCGPSLHTNTLTVGNGVSLELESVGSASPFSGLRIRVAFAESGKDMPTETTVTLNGASFLHFESGPVKRQIQYDPATKEYYIEAKAVNINKFDTFLPGMQKNTKAGSTLFNSVSSPGKGGAIADKLADSRSDLSKVLTGLSLMLGNPGSKAELARALTAGAGASISVLGPALAEDLHRQLGSMRNRSLAPANDLSTDAKASFPTWHAWITGETGYHKLDADGFAPGYTLNSWGGSVGADASLSAHTSVGLALTAMYGDLDTESADSTSGNLDTVYLSGFLRHAIGAWSHTVALSVGMADVELDRTVNYGISSYRTNGSSDGLAFGLLYEVGYTKLVNKRGTFSIQPIANVELRHAIIDGYTETGSDAGLQVDDIEQTVLTFGAGVRVQSLLSERAFNNTAMLEARALVKADVGDRSGTSNHAIINDTTHAEVESAEVGTIGMEAGLGLSLPLGRNLGSILLDGSIEFRSGWTSANASVGYRISF